MVKQLGWSTLNVQLQSLNHLSNSAEHVGRRMLQKSHAEMPHKSFLTGDLSYMLTVAAIVMASMVVIHVLINLTCSCLHKEIPDVLFMPCLEVLLMGLMLVALCFYASIPLGSNLPEVSKYGKSTLAIHFALCLPYVAFLFWLAAKKTYYSSGLIATTQRFSVQQQVSKHIQLLFKLNLLA